jgi:hypothetical protein
MGVEVSRALSADLALKVEVVVSEPLSFSCGRTCRRGGLSIAGNVMFFVRVLARGSVGASAGEKLSTDGPGTGSEAFARTPTASSAWARTAPASSAPWSHRWYSHRREGGIVRGERVSWSQVSGKRSRVFGGFSVGAEKGSGIGTVVREVRRRVREMGVRKS